MSSASTHAGQDQLGEAPPSDTTPVRRSQESVGDSASEERSDLGEQWLELTRVTQRTALETVRTFLEAAERVPLVGRGVSATGRLARMEHDALRGLIRGGLVDVNVGVNVDVLSKGLHVDVLRHGVNVGVLSREARF